MGGPAAGTAWLTVIGIGDDGLAGLSPLARSALDEAEAIFGARRHLASLEGDPRPCFGWSSPFRDSVDRLLELRGRKVAVLASGDPMWFGAGSTLVRSIPPAEMRVIPAPSAFSLAASRLGWPVDEADCLTVHGRPVERLHSFIVPGARLLIYCQNGESPARIAALLCGRGFGDSRLVALSHLGGKRESRVETTAAAWPLDDLPNLTTLAVECVAGPDAVVLSSAPGLPDEAFRHDGQLTKREVRAATLAALAPLPRQGLWDIGAGCGSIAIEWCRAAKGAAATAIEADDGRLALIRENALALGVPELAIVAGRAPESLAGLAPPDAVFIGGGLTAEGMLDAAWAALSPGGRLVANAVTLEGEQRLIAAHRSWGGELVRIAVWHAAPVGSFEGWRAMMPVTQLRLVKR